jgi:hypothetical protein
MPTVKLSEVEQVVLVLLLENSRYLTVTLIERSSAGRFGLCFDAGSQQIEHEHDDEHEHDSLTSESGLNQGWRALLATPAEFRHLALVGDQECTGRVNRIDRSPEPQQFPPKTTDDKPD